MRILLALGLASALVLTSSLGLASRAQLPARTIAITIDDLPGHPAAASMAELRGMTQSMLAALGAAGATATGFVNESKLAVRGEQAARTALLEMWLDAGIPLGNHTFSHPDINTTPLADYQRDIILGESVTERLMAARGTRARTFRHPYTHTGPTEEIKSRLQDFLVKRGYTVAPFTVENADYIFAAIHRKAALSGDLALAVRAADAYLAHTAAMLDFYEPLTIDTAGRDIAQILLIHVNDINSATLSRVLDLFKARGYRFVSLAEALRDPAYALFDAYVGPAGPSWLHRWRVAKGLPSRLRDEPDPPKWAMEIGR